MKFPIISSTPKASLRPNIKAPPPAPSPSDPPISVVEPVRCVLLPTGVCLGRHQIGFGLWPFRPPAPLKLPSHGPDQHPIEGRSPAHLLHAGIAEVTGLVAL